mmetsp:Transcript_20691/g.37290  ORF Transcript_20691/g.37290 Transcript_20691/m.37290 type:complete len:458 (-) Transcript_20691:176-1549(-)|eukprot:CAMPEP_0197625642 /NCGR_PEP_ID=MMETSP1338-20131121/4948_1 /TAXON_ID=43686 ORGANISM="Pelagodinium beii, Strain RCC1491" /NCGR_SAMPLE_ID=MMETSP1338 /ASSEMBLY_ACC=CAM_ASM_000754 /LENGTH=457 /DNA_ID=CAMNT_0043196097 /DNA_START=47 /DNA_END=1420 /DNA_ORIENTATION=-
MDDLTDVLKELNSVLEESAVAESEVDSSILIDAQNLAVKIEADLLREWDAMEAAEPTQPHRSLGINPQLGADKDVVKDKFFARMSVCLVEDRYPKGAGRILLMRAKRAFELLTDDERWEAYEANREARIKEGSLGKLRFGNGFYEGGIQPGSLETDKPVREGKGVEVLNTGEMYDGQFEKDLRKGLGVCIWNNGDVFLGNWRNDKMRGKGMYFYGSGVRYVGNFNQGLPSGKGFMMWPDGSQYGGHLENGARNGSGTLVLPKSTAGYPVGSYTGQWQDNLMSGKGRYEITDAKGGITIYEGEFKENLFHGRGKLEMPGGAVYEGSFLRGKPDGDACEYQLKGNDEIYSGDFRSGKRSGFGEASSSIFNYKGYFKDDKPHGEGIMTVKSGSRNLVMSGDWVAGELDGNGDITWPTGAKYSGKVSKGVMSGLGAFTFEDGSNWEGKFIENNAEAAMHRQ